MKVYSDVQVTFSSQEVEQRYANSSASISRGSYKATTVLPVLSCAGVSRAILLGHHFNGSDFRTVGSLSSKSGAEYVIFIFTVLDFASIRDFLCFIGGGIRHFTM